MYYFESCYSINSMLEVGIVNSNFLDITSLEHRFPKNLKGLEIPITLLHNHLHAPINYVLVYEKDFKKATYLQIAEAEKHFYPCSWFYEDEKVIPYEFSDEKLDYDMN